MRQLLQIDPTTLPSGLPINPTTGQGQVFPSGLTTGCGTLYFSNMSYVGLNVVLEDGSVVMIPAWWTKPVPVKKKSNQIWLSVAYELNTSGNPISLLCLEAYQADEDTSKLAAGPLTYQSTTGNIVSTVPTFTGIYNVRDPIFGAKGNGVTDDTTAILAAVAAANVTGGQVLMPVGVNGAPYIISAPIVLTHPDVRLVGQGGKSILQASAGFTGSALVQIAADYCGVQDMTLVGGPNLSSAANPALDGIDVTGARFTIFERLQFQYINGWAMAFVNNGAVNCAGGQIYSVHTTHCAQGISATSAAATNWVGQLFFTDIHLETIDNGDGLFLLDIQDITLTQINGAVNGAAVVGSLIHVKGFCNAHFFTNVDLGVSNVPTVTNAIVLIETGPNGTPANISFVNGVVQKGQPSVLVSDGQDIAFERMKFKTSQADGVQVTATGVITFVHCTWATSNQTGTNPAYDLNLNMSGICYIVACRFETPIGVATPGQVNTTVRDNTGAGRFLSNFFDGVSTSSQVFTGTPRIVRGSEGYNPRGSIGAPAIGASPFVTSTSQQDVMIIFTAINSLTAFKIGGVAVGVLPVAGVPYIVFARQSLELDYSAAAPTWQWYGL